MRIDQHSLNVSSLSAPMMFYYSYNVGRDRIRRELVDALEAKFGPFTSNRDLKSHGGHPHPRFKWTMRTLDITRHSFVSDVQFTFSTRELLEEFNEFLKPLYVEPETLRVISSHVNDFARITDEIQEWIASEAREGRFHTSFRKYSKHSDSDRLNHHFQQFIFTDKKAAMMFKLIWGGA